MRSFYVFHDYSSISAHVLNSLQRVSFYFLQKQPVSLSYTMAKTYRRNYQLPSSATTTPSTDAKRRWPIYYYCSFVAFAVVLLFPRLTLSTFYTHGNKSLAKVVARRKLEEASTAENDTIVMGGQEVFDKLKSVRLDLQYWAILDPRHLIQYEKKLVRYFSFYYFNYKRRITKLTVAFNLFLCITFTGIYQRISC